MFSIKLPPRINDFELPALPWHQGAWRLVSTGAVFVLSGAGLVWLLVRAQQTGDAPPTWPSVALAAVCVVAGLWFSRTLARVRTPIRFKIHHGHLEVTGPGRLGLFGRRMRDVPTSSIRDVTVTFGPGPFGIGPPYARLRVHRRGWPALCLGRATDRAELDRVAGIIRSALKLDRDPRPGKRRRSEAVVM
jgi:hypothetical protein